MNLPNAITLSRIFLAPVLVVVLLTRSNIENRELWGVGLFLAAAMTDWLDGYLARLRREVTTLGKLLDPIADKLLISAAFISLVQMGLAPAWMVVVIVGREFAVSGLRSIASSEGFTIDASGLGKSKMVSQVAAITLLILGNKMTGSWMQAAGEIALWVVVVFAILSMVQYFRRFWGQIDERIKHRERRLSRLAELRRKERNA